MSAGKWGAPRLTTPSSVVPRAVADDEIDSVVAATQSAIDKAIEIVLTERSADPLRRIAEILREEAGVPASLLPGGGPSPGARSRTFDPRDI